MWYCWIVLYTECMKQLNVEQVNGSSVEFTLQVSYCVPAEEASSSKGRNGNFEPQRRWPELDPSGDAQPDQYVLVASCPHTRVLCDLGSSHTCFCFVHLCSSQTTPTLADPPLCSLFSTFALQSTMKISFRIVEINSKSDFQKVLRCAPVPLVLNALINSETILGKMFILCVASILAHLLIWRRGACTGASHQVAGKTFDLQF